MRFDEVLQDIMSTTEVVIMGRADAPPQFVAFTAARLAAAAHRTII
jgi:hypothetical protein